jgi:hypothetical protein
MTQTKRRPAALDTRRGVNPRPRAQRVGSTPQRARNPQPPYGRHTDNKFAYDDPLRPKMHAPTSRCMHLGPTSRCMHLGPTSRCMHLRQDACTY